MQKKDEFCGCVWGEVEKEKKGKEIVKPSTNDIKSTAK